MTTLPKEIYYGDTDQDCILIWNIVAGPFNSDDMPDDEYEREDGWVVVCLIENGYGGLYHEEISFDTFDDAYEVVSWFKNQKKPYVMELEPEEPECE